VAALLAAACAPDPGATLRREHAVALTASRPPGVLLSDLEGPIREPDDSAHASWTVPARRAWPDYLAAVAPRLEAQGYVCRLRSADRWEFVKRAPKQMLQLTLEPLRDGDGCVHAALRATPDR
jgi:hypothetical protein